MVLKANDRRTSCSCHDEFRGPRSDYVDRDLCMCEEQPQMNSSSRVVMVTDSRPPCHELSLVPLKTRCVEELVSRPNGLHVGMVWNCGE
ncbi:hypothetical protein TNCV_4950701 [Trichonephila clavipes]|nr:hypothetical protein TNCV_4950701 [Trichonephila clavipes]